MTTLDSPYGLTKPADLVPEYGDSTFENAEFKCSQNTGVFRWKNATGHEAVRLVPVRAEPRGDSYLLTFIF